MPLPLSGHAIELGARFAGGVAVAASFVPVTHGITIAAPPETIWPWLVQMGCRRGGWYSWDTLDNAGRPSARAIVDELQHLEVGQVLVEPIGFVMDRRMLEGIKRRAEQRHQGNRPSST